MAQFTIKSYFYLCYFFTGLFTTACAALPITFFKQHLLPILPSDSHLVILEAGMNEGEDTEQLSKLFPNATIYAFEPIPSSFDKAVKRLANYANIKCFDLALGAISGEAEMYISQLQGNAKPWELSSSLLEPTGHLKYFKNICFPKKIIVEVINLDEWVIENEIERIDFMWLDMQGVEPEVLKNSPSILGTVKVIYTEISRKELYKGQILYPEFKEFMINHGFTQVIEETPGAFHGNALFIRP